MIIVVPHLLALLAPHFETEWNRLEWMLQSSKDVGMQIRCWCCDASVETKEIRIHLEGFVDADGSEFHQPSSTSWHRQWDDIFLSTRRMSSLEMRRQSRDEISWV